MVGTVVERSTRFTVLVHLSREDGYRHKEPPKNGPALAGRGALTMKYALANTMSTMNRRKRWVAFRPTSNGERFGRFARCRLWKQFSRSPWPPCCWR